MKPIDGMLPRRDFLKGAGALVIGFALARCGAEQGGGFALGSYGPPEDEIDSWISISSNGTATLHSGCCEIGTGSSTGLLQVVAEELDIAFENASLTSPDTLRTVDQFVSSGSRTITIHSRPIRQAAAEARAALVHMAAERLGVSADQLVTQDGVVSVKNAPDAKVSYGELIGDRRFNLKITGKVKPKDSSQYKIVGQPVKRIDTAAKVFGAFAFIQDVKVSGMLHGRVVRPPAHGASVVAIDESSVADLPGLVKVVREHDLVGVVCEREEQAVRAVQALKVTWTEWAGLPDMKDLYATIRQTPEFPSGYADAPERRHGLKDLYTTIRQTLKFLSGYVKAPERSGGVIANVGDVPAGLASAAKVVTANYAIPYHHHGSIGPSCAVADVRSDSATIWTGTQSPYGLRDACAKFLGFPNQSVRVIYVQASGCYGQNGADDVVIDALVLSRAVGKPVRVQWMRQDENGWETYKSARWSECQGGIDKDGKIVAWDTRAWGFSGYARPEYHEPVHGGTPGSLITAQLAGWTEAGLEEGFGGASGNFDPVYADIPNKLVKFIYLGPTSHRQGPLRMRVGSMRGIGSPDNIFIAECFMDELAAAAGVDALEFRLRHKPTDRMRTLFNVAAERANWQSRPSHSNPTSGNIARGRGIAALGTTHATNVVGIFEVEVNRTTGIVHLTRAVVAQDCGLIVNPNSATDQVEGGVVQALSRALYEEVTFDRSRVTSLDWSKYRIIRFPEIPDQVEVILVNRPDLPPMSVGEPGSQCVWPAMSNAIYDAVGVRLRQLPFTPQRVLEGLAATRRAAL
jgi:nicotinate dehydrogenase subunit B